MDHKAVFMWLQNLKWLSGVVILIPPLSLHDAADGHLHALSRQTERGVSESESHLGLQGA